MRNLTQFDHSSRAGIPHYCRKCRPYEIGRFGTKGDCLGRRGWLLVGLALYLACTVEPKVAISPHSPHSGGWLRTGLIENGQWPRAAEPAPMLP